jgi:hypothetical protein
LKTAGALCAGGFVSAAVIVAVDAVKSGLISGSSF